jgi:hypothetical protein
VYDLDSAAALSYFNVAMRAGQQLNERKIFRKASLQERLRAGLVFLCLAGLFGLLVLAAQSKINIGWLIGGCGFKQKYNLPCPGCGMTASVLAFGRGEILKAFYNQPAAALFCCVLAIVAFLTFFIAIFGVYIAFLNRFFTKLGIKSIIFAVLAVIAAGWAVTLTRALLTNSRG